MRRDGLKHLGLSALAAALLVAGALFGGWFAAFIVMRLVGKSLLVGMNYLAWPIVFPLFSLPVVFGLMLLVMPFFGEPYRDILSRPGFLCGILLPLIVIGLAVMLATCPLDVGGTLLTRGWAAFG